MVNIEIEEKINSLVEEYCMQGLVKTTKNACKFISGELDNLHVNMVTDGMCDENDNVCTVWDYEFIILFDLDVTPAVSRLLIVKDTLTCRGLSILENVLEGNVMNKSNNVSGEKKLYYSLEDV